MSGTLHARARKKEDPEMAAFLLIIQNLQLLRRLRVRNCLTITKEALALSLARNGLRILSLFLAQICSKITS